MEPSKLRKRHRRNCRNKRRLTMEEAAHETGLVLASRRRPKPGREPLGLYVCLVPVAALGKPEENEDTRDSVTEGL